MRDKRFWKVPKVWPRSTIVIIGCGPSINDEQIRHCKEAMENLDVRIIVINDAYKLVRTADILYSCDSRWWKWHEAAPMFLGMRIGLAWDSMEMKWFEGWNLIEHSNIRFITSTGIEGLEENPKSVRTGNCSGYQAINLAVHFGAKRIVLLGYDMKSQNGKHHWFGNHPDNVAPPPYDIMIPGFDTLLEPLKKLKVEVINCTPDSALKTFPIKSIEEAL